jgi:hypothetical protein
VSAITTAGTTLFAVFRESRESVGMELENPQLNRQGGRSNLSGPTALPRPQGMGAEEELAGSLTAFTCYEIAYVVTAPGRSTRATIPS